MSETQMVPVSGSNKDPLENAKLVGDATGDERFNVTVRVRRRNAHQPGLSETETLSERRYASREEHALQHGADPADLALVEAFAKQHGLKVVESSAPKAQVLLSGTAAAFGRAFGVDLKLYDHPSGRIRGRSGPVCVPPELERVVTGVFGLDNRPFARPHIRRTQLQVQAAMAAAATGAPELLPPGVPKGFTPVDVARLYNFPTSVNGSGQTIGVIELGGGFAQSELDTYFQGIGVAPPKVRAVSFPGAGNNTPGVDTKSDGEVMLDLEVIGGVAPGAQMAVYFGDSPSDQAFINALAAAVADNVNNPSIISISWGGPEANATSQFQTEFNQILQDAQSLGITVCVASGDDASADFPLNDPENPWDSHAHVDFPASSPFVLGCGGTSLAASNHTITRETVWHSAKNEGTGGGISRAFPLPSYQLRARVPRATNPKGSVMRGVPDVSGDADPATGYRTLVDGQAFPGRDLKQPNQFNFPSGGTSAVAPLWAGLIALLNQALGHKLGFINPLLYNLPSASGAFHDVTVGNNGDYKAATGWDPCTGLGTPNGQKLLDALRAVTPVT